MQISGQYNYNRLQLVALETKPATAHHAGKQQRLRQANDSYAQNAASAQVIDAEYVDLYTPDTHQPQRPTILLEPNRSAEKSVAQEQQFPASQKYQGQTPDTPPPGTYINYFA